MTAPFELDPLLLGSHRLPAMSQHADPQRPQRRSLPARAPRAAWCIRYVTASRSCSSTRRARGAPADPTMSQPDRHRSWTTRAELAARDRAVDACRGGHGGGPGAASPGRLRASAPQSADLVDAPARGRRHRDGWLGDRWSRGAGGGWPGLSGPGRASARVGFTRLGRARDDLVLAVSSSGRTAETLSCTQTALDRGASVVVVAAAGSPLGRAGRTCAACRGSWSRTADRRGPTSGRCRCRCWLPPITSAWSRLVSSGSTPSRTCSTTSPPMSPRSADGDEPG